MTRLSAPASSRATARPAKLAPQIKTSASPSTRVRSAPRFVFRTGTRARLGEGQRDHSCKHDDHADHPSRADTFAEEERAGSDCDDDAGLAQCLYARNEGLGSEANGRQRKAEGTEHRDA